MPLTLLQKGSGFSRLKRSAIRTLPLLDFLRGRSTMLSSWLDLREIAWFGWEMSSRSLKYHSGRILRI